MKNVAHPLVSIVIPVFNGSNFLSQAIESALAQTYEPTEIIVVNDGSSDGGKTRDIALSYGDRLRYFEKENGGVATALNLGAMKMRGEYFSWLSHDDEFLPHKLATQISFFGEIANPKESVLFSSFIVHDLLSGNNYEANYLQSQVMNSDPFRSWLMTLFNSTIHGCTSLLPAGCFRKVGLFDVKQRTTQDYDFFVRLLRNGYRFYYQDQPSIITRHHSEQDTRRISDVHLQDVHLYFLRLVDVFAAELQRLSREEIAPFLDILAARGQGEARSKLESLWSSGPSSPLSPKKSEITALSESAGVSGENSLPRRMYRRVVPARLRAAVRSFLGRAGTTIPF